MRTIVVPVSFTGSAANAARYAADLALAIGAGVNLVYVLPVSAVPHLVFRELRDSGYILLKELHEELTRRTAGKVPISTDLETGSVESKLKAYCEQEKPFMVVMGAVDGTTEKQLNGGDTIQSMRRLPYPVLTVPEKAVFHDIRKIVVACDEEDIFSGVSTVLPFLNDLARLLDARFEMVHVVTDGVQSASDVLQEYNAWQRDVPAFEPVMHLVRRPKVEEGISQFLATHRADWLLVLPKKHTIFEFHKRQAQHIAPHCPVPLMSLHE